VLTIQVAGQASLVTSKEFGFKSNETALLVRHNSTANIVIFYSGYSLKL
jgi:hypothetical protein